MGAHKRHGCLLPLEMYLEEDIPLVCYVRDKPYAEMVELPEQSCHCFMSFSNAAAPHPSLKVCCWAPSHLRTGSLCLWLMAVLCMPFTLTSLRTSLRTDDTLHLVLAPTSVLLQ